MTSRSLSPFLALLLVLLLHGAAEAHGYLIGSFPRDGETFAASPRHVSLLFSEPINDTLSGVLVRDPSGHDVPVRALGIAGQVQLRGRLPSLAPGTYLVLWTSVSADDGHVLQGNFRFSVGHRGRSALVPPGYGGTNGPTTWEDGATVAARWLELITSAFWIGASLFLTMALLAGSIPVGAARGLRRVGRVLPAALALGIAGAVADLLLEAHVIRGAWRQVADAGLLASLLLRSSYGYLWLLRVALTVVALGAALLLVRRPDRGDALRTGAQLGKTPIILALAVANAYLLAASGHAADLTVWTQGHSHAGSATPAVLIDLAHVLASGVWAGGIWAVLLVIGGRDAEPDDLRWLVRHFSPWAVAAVASLIVSGAFNGVEHVPSVGDLWTTLYGGSLVVKMTAMAVMMGISALLLRRPGSVHSMARYRRWLPVSGCLALLVFLATAVMNSYPVPREPQSSARSSLRSSASNCPCSSTVRAENICSMNSSCPGTARSNTSLPSSVR